MRGPGNGSKILLIDPDLALASQAIELLRAQGHEAHAVGDAETGLRKLAAFEPDVLLLELEMPGRDGLWLLRRLRDEYMGPRPRVIVTMRAEAVIGRLADVGVDAVVLKPATPAEIALACAPRMDPADDPERDPERLRELVKMTILPSEVDMAMAQLAQRLALTYRTKECVVIGAVSDRQWMGVARGPIDESPDAPIWDRCRVALDAGAPVYAGGENGQLATYVAVPIEAPGGTRLGVILLFDEQPRLFTLDTVDALRALGGRLYAEMAWRSVHERIAADRDRLRESSMLDPMLGVWTRAALDQALPGEVSACQRRGEPMSVAVLDLRGTRHLNERYGHLVGDLALRHVASMLRAALRTQDIVARWSGDTMAVVLAGAAPEDARMVIERLQQQIADAPLEHDGNRVPVTVAAGLAPLLGEDDSGEAALARAAVGVKAAKRRRLGLLLVTGDTPEAEAELAAAPGEGLEVGKTLGGMYQVLHEISRGAMGVVYRAEDLGLGRPVALKTLRPDLARDKSFVERFRTEAATLAAIRHENLVQVYAFGTDGEDVYFVMELVEGEPLEDRIEMAKHEGRRVPVEHIDSVIAQIAAALDAMHRAGVLHRDVKPANILLDRVQDRAVLVDVGIAKKRGSETDPAGTPGFTAPESFTGGVEGPATDVYGLAATAFELLALAPAFGEGTAEEILARQRNIPTVVASHWRTGLSAAADEVLLRALDPDPARRFTTATEFARALSATLSVTAAEARPEAEAAPRRAGAGVGLAKTDPASRAAALASAAPLGQGRLSSIPMAIMESGGTSVGVTQLTDVDLEEIEDTNRPTPPPIETKISFTTPRGGTESRASLIGVSVPPGGAGGLGARFPSMREPDAPPTGVAHTRGVLFRSAYRVLGARQGAAWVSHVSRKDPQLAQALQPQNTLLSWHPTEVFVAMLRAIASSGRDARAFAHELGRVATAATFSRFFGADPSALSPWQVFSATDLFWRRYHTWGLVTVERRSLSETEIVISDTPHEALVCASTSGIFEQIGTLAGAVNTQVLHAACEAGGADKCRFLISWQSPRISG